MIEIGDQLLNRPLALAPMEDVTDRAFRSICKERGADLLFTEFASSEALVRDARKTWDKIQIGEEERPVAVQIFGGVEQSMEGAAALAEQAGPDFVDINCGCWVKKVALREAGAGLLRDLSKFRRIVASVMRGTSLPVTVKTRLGWDAESINILDVARMLEDLGVRMLTVHCRTRNQGHKGEAAWNWLERLKTTVRMPIVGNGDVTTPEDVRRMFETGCDGVMIGRGAIQNPWIFDQAKRYLATGVLSPDPSAVDRVSLCIEHLNRAVYFKGERKGTVEFRKHYAGYLKGLPRVAKLRAALQQETELAPIVDQLERYKDECAAWAA